jgi:LysR family transcriptional activator of mexEF-oprN operon
MNERNFAGVDLNLLVVFAVLMREQSTTRASERLFLSQSAVSHSLRRLRALFEDELFVRSSQGLTPTPRAESLYRDLLPSLDSIEGKLRERDTFAPAVSERIFRLGMPSALDVCVTPILLDRLAAQAPAVNLVIRPVDRYTAPGMLDAEDIHLGLSNFPAVEHRHRRQDLGPRNFACLFDGRRLAIAAPISLEQYLSSAHVLTSFVGDRTGVVDTALAEMGLSRRVLVATPDFSSIPFYLATANAVATLPTYAARIFADRLGLTYSELPFAVPDFMLSLLWHSRIDHDPGHLWFRRLVAQTVAML